MSWERSRYIPWSRIEEVSGPDSYESQKDRLYRTLQKEANKEKDLLENSKKQQQSSDVNSSFVPPEVIAEESKKKKGLFNSGVDFSTPDLVRTFAFGKFAIHVLHVFDYSVLFMHCSSTFMIFQVDVSVQSQAQYSDLWTV